MTIGTVSCPSCEKQISPAAYDCPSCGHPVRKPKRSFIGKLFKLTFILFNLLMVIWLFSAFGTVGDQLNTAASGAERAGTAIGGTIGLTFILMIWVFGDIILGTLVLFTRPKR